MAVLIFLILLDLAIVLYVLYLGLKETDKSFMDSLRSGLPGGRHTAATGAMVTGTGTPESPNMQPSEESIAVDEFIAEENGGDGDESADSERVRMMSGDDPQEDKTMEEVVAEQAGAEESSDTVDSEPAIQETGEEAPPTPTVEDVTEDDTK